VLTFGRRRKAGVNGTAQQGPVHWLQDGLPPQNQQDSDSALTPTSAVQAGLRDQPPALREKQNLVRANSATIESAVQNRPASTEHDRSAAARVLAACLLPRWP
jgi:hypothetical protein